MFEGESVTTPEGQAPLAPSNEGMPQPGTAPDASVAQAPPVAPPVAAAPQPATPPVDMAEYEELRRFRTENQPKLQQLEQQQRQWQMDQALGQEIAEYQGRLEAVGLPAETAKAFAADKYKDRAAYMGLQGRALEAMQGYTTNVQTGVDVLVKRGVLDAERGQAVKQMLQLALQHRDPMQARQQMDDQFGLRSEMRQLKKELAALKQGKVPPQNFESGMSGGGGSSHEAYRQALREGKPLPSSQEIDRIVAQAMQRG